MKLAEKQSQKTVKFDKAEQYITKKKKITDCMKFAAKNAKENYKNRRNSNHRKKHFSPPLKPKENYCNLTKIPKVEIVAVTESCVTKNSGSMKFTTTYI